MTCLSCHDFTVIPISPDKFMAQIPDQWAGINADYIQVLGDSAANAAYDQALGESTTIAPLQHGDVVTIYPKSNWKTKAGGGPVSVWTMVDSNTIRNCVNGLTEPLVKLVADSGLNTVHLDWRKAYTAYPPGTFPKGVQLKCVTSLSELRQMSTVLVFYRRLNGISTVYTDGAIFAKTSVTVTGNYVIIGTNTYEITSTGLRRTLTITFPDVAYPATETYTWKTGVGLLLDDVQLPPQSNGGEMQLILFTAVKQ